MQFPVNVEANGYGCGVKPEALLWLTVMVVFAAMLIHDWRGTIALWRGWMIMWVGGWIAISNILLGVLAGAVLYVLFRAKEHTS